MNTSWNWKNLKEIMILVVGALLCFGLFSVNRQLVTNGRNADGGHGLVCLELKALEQPVEEYAPCMRPSVYRLWKDEPIVTLSERLCIVGARVEGCEE